MAWKCALCDSYNEDGSKICFVCGEERSASSIIEEETRRREEETRRREEAARHRREKLVRVKERSFRGLGAVGKSVWAISAGTAALMVVLLLAGKIMNGQLDDLFTALGETARRAWWQMEQLFEAFPGSVEMLLGRVGGNFERLLQNAGAALERMFG